MAACALAYGTIDGVPLPFAVPTHPHADHQVPLRRYQQLALQEFDDGLARADRRAYLVLPPGAGKTRVGLEAAARTGRRTLVLTPNTAVQQQWLEQHAQFIDPAGTDPAGASRDLTATVTVLTYQRLTVWDRTGGEPDVSNDTSTGSDADPVTAPVPTQLARARRAATRDLDQPEELLALLHPNARSMLTFAAGLGPWTLVLDECHHLIETWGALALAFTRALGDDVVVIGLTATPPVALSAPQRRVHDALFGTADFAVATPAVVKEGDLAPYAELLYLSSPTPEEDTWIASERTRFAQLQLELVDTAVASLPFPEWLRRRSSGSSGETGAALSWREREAAEPQLALATLRFAHTGMVPVPDGARLREEHRVAPDATDWAELLAAFSNEVLAVSGDARDARLRTAVRQVLPGLGFTLTRNGLRNATSPVDRVCALSSAKAAAAAHIIDVEHDALGEDLRALVLCDFEQLTAETRSSLHAAARADGSARLVLTTLAYGHPQLHPVLVTGRAVTCHRDSSEHVLTAVQQHTPGLRLRSSPVETGSVLVQLVSDDRDWTPRTWTGALTRTYITGAIRVLVGTRALLGEGWDCPPVNVIVDLTSAATPVAVAQLRGRSLRLDPARPGKVASNWTVACVADDHPRGDADYLRAARKHTWHLAPDSSGEISTGIGHCDPRLSPFSAPDADLRAAVTAAALERTAARDQTRAAWEIGAGYAAETTATLRLRLASLGWVGLVTRHAARPTVALGAGELVGVERSAVLRAGTRHGLAALSPLARAGVATFSSVGGAVLLSAGTGTTSFGAAVTSGAVAAGAVAVAAAGAAAVRLGGQHRALEEVARSPTATLAEVAHVLADALHQTGGVSAGASGVRVLAGDDGWLRCELHGVTQQESELFASSLDELLAPLTEPRYLLSRLVVQIPADRGGRWRLAAQRATGLHVDAAVAWHAVPTWLARNRERAQVLHQLWTARIGPSELLRAGTPEGAAVLALLRGADPFAVTSQMRTTWH